MKYNDIRGSDHERMIAELLYCEPIEGNTHMNNWLIIRPDMSMAKPAMRPGMIIFFMISPETDARGYD